MKKLIMTIGLLFSLVLPVAADELKFQWSYPGSEAAMIDGFRLFMDTSETFHTDAIDPLVTTVTVPREVDQQCHNYWLVAYTGQAVSGNSDIATVCPDMDSDPSPADQPPITVGGFTVQIVVAPL